MILSFNFENLFILFFFQSFKIKQKIMMVFNLKNDHFN